MPIKKVKGGYQYGNQKVFPTKAQARAQAAAIHIAKAPKKGKR